MRIFKSKKSKRLNAVFFFTFIVIIGATIPALVNDVDSVFYIVIGINLLTLILLLSIALKTEYKIDKNFLHYQSGPFFGKILISTITKIQHHNGIFVPTVCKPALSQVGLIITYNKFDTIYISPLEEEEFLQLMITLNPTIEIHQIPISI